MYNSFDYDSLRTLSSDPKKRKYGALFLSSLTDREVLDLECFVHR